MGFGLDKFDAGVVTARLELHEISADKAKPLTLLVQHAGVTNKAWDNFMLRRPTPKLGAPAAEPTSPEALAAERLADRAEAQAFACEMLSQTSIVGWENVFEDGEPAVFSVAAARRLLDEMAKRCPDVLMRINRFVSSIANFRGAIVDPVDVGKG